MNLNSESLRRLPVDTIMSMVEREWRSGRLGIGQDADVEPLIDIYEQSPDKDFRFPDTQADRLSRQTCPHCKTAFRASDQRDPGRCPYCWRLI